jgi:hypothetical protein
MSTAFANSFGSGHGTVLLSRVHHRVGLAFKPWPREAEQ